MTSFDTTTSPQVIVDEAGVQEVVGTIQAARVVGLDCEAFSNPSTGAHTVCLVMGCRVVQFCFGFV